MIRAITNMFHMTLCRLIFIIEQRNSRFSTTWPWPKCSRSNVKYINISQTVRARTKLTLWLLCRLIFAIKWHNCECCSQWPWPKFSRSNFSVGYFDMYQLEKMQTLLLPSDRQWGICHQIGSNGVIANVVHHDFDLHFRGDKIWNVNIWKMMRVSEKCSSIIFIEIDICHRMGPLRFLYSMILTFIFKVKHFLVMHLF